MKRLLIILLAIVSYACNTYKKELSYSFYYWQQANVFSDTTRQLISDLNISRFYVHLMDVVWDDLIQAPTPIAVSTLSASNPVTKQTMVPVIFITNEVMEKTDSVKLPALANNIISVSKVFIKRMGEDDLSEIQLDCDWTAKTRNKYFQLLQLLKQASPSTIYSATIRLYPYKYDQIMGVPPVDYGALMIYNIASIRKPEEVNSLFTYKEFSKYKRTTAYPIPLKPIIPVFGWYAWFRGNNYKGILYESPEFSKEPFFEKISTTKFRLTKDTVINNQYLRNGDVLRNEFPDKRELLALSKNLGNLPLHTTEIIFYHWNESFLQYYAPVLQKIIAP